MISFSFQINYNGHAHNNFCILFFWKYFFLIIFLRTVYLYDKIAILFFYLIFFDGSLTLKKLTKRSFFRRLLICLFFVVFFNSKFLSKVKKNLRRCKTMKKYCIQKQFYFIFWFFLFFLFLFFMLLMCKINWNTIKY
jgi:hypothetical protein